MSLKRLSAFTAMVALGAMVVVPVMAQPGGGGRGGMRGGGMGGIGRLLMSEDVRGEVGIEAEQLEELEVMRDEIRDEMRERMGDLFRGMRDMSDEERELAREEIRTEMEQIQKDVQSKVAGVLTESQMKRLNQIELQQRVERGGTQALLRGDVAKKLGISDEQLEKMRQKAQEEQAKLREDIAKLQQESRERILSVLTDSQQAQLKEMMGEKYDMPQQNFRGRGQDRGQGGNRGGRAQRGRPELE